MANLAPPISRGGFIYHGALYVDVGNLNRHARASFDELTALLRPEKSSAPAAKDQVGHWYIAQLKHYGLSTTKDKNAAKLRLLNALNSGDLKVPADVKRIESSLKKEYDAENRKAKAAAKAAEVASFSKAYAAKKKDDAPKNTNGPKRKRDDTTEAGASMPSSKWPRPIAKAVGPKGQKATSKQTSAAFPAREPKTSAKSKDIAQLREDERKEKAAIRAITKKVRKLHADSKGDRHDDDYDPWDQNDIDSDTISDTEWTSKRKQSGVYTVTVSGNNSQWQSVRYDASPNELILCKDGDQMWGSYKFDVYEGILRMQPGPKREIQGLMFEWRGRQQLQPGIWQDSTGKGEILFEEDQVIKGTFFNLQNYRYEFSSKRKMGLAGESRRGGKSYESEWTALGRANNWTGPAPLRTPAGEQFPRGAHVARRGGSNQGASRTPKRVKTERPDSMEIDYDASTDPYLLAQISGTYKVDSNISDLWSQNTEDLELELLVDNDRLWGSFSWGPFNGVIQMNPGPSKFCSNTYVTFEWRVRHNETGDLTFGRRCTGYMIFYGGGRVAGELNGLYGKSIGFQAERQPGAHWRGRSAASFEGEWTWFVEEAYRDR